MNRRGLVVVVLVTLLVGAGVSAATAARPQTAKGQVTQVDATARTVVINEAAKGAPPREVSFTLGQGASIMMGRKHAAFTDLKAGDQVTITYTGTGDQRQAQRVEIAAAKVARKTVAHKPDVKY